MTRCRRGAALFGVTSALALLGVLLAGVAFEVLRAQRAVRRDAAVLMAFGAAERELYEAFAALPIRDPLLHAIGGTTHWTAAAPGDATVQLSLTRLAPATLLLEATAAAGLGPTGRALARRRTGLLLVVDPARLAIGGAMTTGAPILTPGGSGAVRVNGRDTLFADGWRCDAADSASVAGVIAPPAVPVLLDSSAVDGMPPRAEHAMAAGADAYALVLPAPSAAVLASNPLDHPGSLIAPAVAPSTDAGACAAQGGASHNWGDPARPAPCAGYMPVIHVHGDLVAPSGRGQGVLIVDGDLTLAGGFDFWGVIVVRGRLTTHGAGNRIVGALLAHGNGASHELRALDLRYASCVVRAALQPAGVLRPAAERAWRERW